MCLNGLHRLKLNTQSLDDGWSFAMRLPDMDPHQAATDAECQSLVGMCTARNVVNAYGDYLPETQPTTTHGHRGRSTWNATDRRELTDEWLVKDNAETRVFEAKSRDMRRMLTDCAPEEV